MTLSGEFFIMKLVIKSCPRDFLIGIFLMILLILSEEVTLAGKGPLGQEIQGIFHNFKFGRAGFNIVRRE